MPPVAHGGAVPFAPNPLLAGFASERESVGAETPKKGILKSVSCPSGREALFVLSFYLVWGEEEPCISSRVIWGWW